VDTYSDVDQRDLDSLVAGNLLGIQLQEGVLPDKEHLGTLQDKLPRGDQEVREGTLRDTRREDKRQDRERHLGRDLDKHLGKVFGFVAVRFGIGPHQVES